MLVSVSVRVVRKANASVREFRARERYDKVEEVD